MTSPPLKMFLVKNTCLHSHLILKFCLDFWNKNTEILLQLSGKCLTICIIHNFNFTTDNYRIRALQIQTWYKHSISEIFLKQTEFSFKASCQNASNLHVYLIIVLLKKSSPAASHIASHVANPV